MRIARIRTLKSERVRLYAEGEDEPRLELALDLFVRAGLARGDEVSDERLAELAREDTAYRARQAALSLLSHRARAREELRRRLRRKEFEEPVIERTLAWLEERDYVDDRAFAESFVRDRLRLRPRGRLGLIQELRRKGVADAVSEAAIAHVMENEELEESDLAARAADAWARRNRSSLRKARGSRARGSDDAWYRARRRLYGHLARRGFAPDAIRAAIEGVLDD